MRDLAKTACAAAVAVALVAFLLWFVLFVPAPDYMPAYGGDPCDVPNRMED